MYSLQSDYVLRKSSFDMNSHSETFSPLICCVVDVVSQSLHVVNFSEVKPQLRFSANLVFNWIQIWMLRPQAWWIEREVWDGRCWQRGCARSVSWHIGRWRTHNRSHTCQTVAVESEACYGITCSKIRIVLSIKTEVILMFLIIKKHQNYFAINNSRNGKI